jgi:hypothetical protein
MHITLAPDSTVFHKAAPHILRLHVPHVPHFPRAAMTMEGSSETSQGSSELNFDPEPSALLRLLLPNHTLHSSMQLMDAYSWSQGLGFAAARSVPQLT